ncbi:hypothetical protein SUGI_0407240 [Cryptomeria japonica]|nr:hypothetical protein SUGI_0407240 [Cryptomeria japonica]
MPASIHREISICSAQLTIGLQTRFKVPKRGVPVTAATGTSSDGFTQIPPAKVMRRILESPGVHQGPACFDALSAKLVEQAGFQFCFMSGFSVSAARLALPDVGLISYGEMIDQGSQITSAVSIPVIGDGDTGYGNILNVKRTVKGYIRAGFAGILLEDQVSPKACGHTQGRKVVSREEAVMRIKAAVDARKESSSDIVIVARTDARQAYSLEESLWRIQAFADAKADVLFIDALTSREEMKAFCNIAPHVPKMVNMLEGGGKTPILSPIELEEFGFKIISYPLSLLGVSIRAMQDALSALKGGRVPPPASLPSFGEIKEVIGFNDYYEEEKRYSINEPPVVSKNDLNQITGSITDDNVSTFLSSMTTNKSEQQTNERGQEDFQETNVEVITPYVLQESTSDDAREPLSGIWSRSLRVKITSADGFEKLDVRIPAGFLEGITNIIPGFAGLNLKSMLDEAASNQKGNLEKGKRLIDINDRIGDRIEVFLE